MLQQLVGAGQAGLLPLCLGRGLRPGQPGGSAWPLLLLQPQGQPVAQWIAGQVQAAGAAACAAGVEQLRQACATRVALRLVLALRAAHALSIVHCDVRPPNIVVGAGGQAVLVDWGLALACGAPSARRGVAAFSAAGVFQGFSYPARPAQDALAVLYTWLALASGSAAAAAPWQRSTLGRMRRARDAWLAERQAMGGAVQRVVEAIAGLSSAEPADPLSAVVQALTGEVGRAAASAGSETLAI